MTVGVRRAGGRIAPAELYGREGELAELAAFCADPAAGCMRGGGRRLGGQVGADVVVRLASAARRAGTVSFFVTARYKGQDDRDAFTNAVLEQLAELLGESIPAYLTATTREPTCCACLPEPPRNAPGGAAAVLVVDGLDEDRGVTTGPDAYSIAAFLPSRPPAGLRVIVAGRPDPPVPADVPDDHPLRDPAIVRELGRSQPGSRGSEKTCSASSSGCCAAASQQYLLGLVAAAGGGLSASRPVRADGTAGVRRRGNSASGGRTDLYGAGRRLAVQDEALPVYVLGHEELQAAASKSLRPGTPGASIGSACTPGQRITARRGWPAGAPEYLLRVTSGFYWNR